MRAPDWDLEPVEVPGGTERGPMGWSPDATRLAVDGAEDVIIVDRDGNTVASVGEERTRPLTWPVLGSLGGPVSGFTGGGIAWGADSQQLAVGTVFGTEAFSVAVVTRDGDLVAQSNYPEFAEALAGAAGMDSPAEQFPVLGGRLDADGELVLHSGVPGDPFEHWTLIGSVSGDTFTWRAESGRPESIPADPQADPEWQEAQDAIADALSDREPLGVWPLAEGLYASWVGPPSPSGEPGAATGLAIYRNGEVEVHELEGHAPQEMESIANNQSNAFDVVRVE